MAIYFELASHLIQISFLLLIFALIGEIESRNVFKQNTEICKNPKKDATFDPVWDNYPAEGAHFVLGNRAFRTHFAQLLKGRDVAENEDYSGICAKTVFGNTKTSVGGYYHGFGNLTYTRNCLISEGDLTCEFTSNVNPDYRETAKVHVTYFGPKNEHNFHIVVYCLNNGKVGWSLPSIRNPLSEDDRTRALKEIESRGFDPEDYVSLYENCDNTNQK